MSSCAGKVLNCITAMFLSYNFESPAAESEQCRNCVKDKLTPAQCCNGYTKTNNPTAVEL